MGDNLISSSQVTKNEKNMQKQQPIGCRCFSVSLYTVTFIEKGKCHLLYRI
ncbi:hypothetical protein C1A50_2620 [Paenibacillus polymyxa]|nr:hypothetical protein C1A50_2620 [Paenibacillus polymyxa]